MYLIDWDCMSGILYRRLVVQQQFYGLVGKFQEQCEELGTYLLTLSSSHPASSDVQHLIIAVVVTFLAVAGVAAYLFVS